MVENNSGDIYNDKDYKVVSALRQLEEALISRSEEETNQDAVENPERIKMLMERFPNAMSVLGEYGEEVLHTANKLIENGFLKANNLSKENDLRQDGTIYKILDGLRGFLGRDPVQRKGIYQSWQLTKAKYDFTIGEKRIFLKIVDICQRYINEDEMSKNCEISVESLLGTGYVPIVTFPIRDILDDNSTNYSWVNDSLERLMGKEFGLPGNSDWNFQKCVLIQRIMSDKKSGRAGVILSHDFWKALCNMQSYKVIDFDVAKKFKSIYAERLYELLNGNTQSITYDLTNIREIFCLENKYKNNSTLVERVFEKAKDEMDTTAECPITFDYKLGIGKRNKIENVTFTVRNKEVKEDDAKKRPKKTLLQDVMDVRLSESVVQAVMKYFPSVQPERDDVNIKLRYAQKYLGVLELITEIQRIRLVCNSQVQKGLLKTTKGGYFLGALGRIVRAKKEEERLKHIYVEPEKPKDDAVYPFKRVNIGKDPELNNIGEDEEYKYYTQAYVKRSATGVGMTVEVWTSKWGFEQIEGGYWRLKK